MPAVDAKTNRMDKIQVAIADQLPAPPAGFGWRMHENVTFLKPVRWHEHVTATHATASHKTTHPVPASTYATSPQPFSETQPFDMGLTIQIIRDARKTLGIEARHVARAYLKPFFDPRHDVRLFEQRMHGDFDCLYLQFKDSQPGLIPIIVYKFIVADDAADRVHDFTFESPARTWDTHWAKYASSILSNLVIDTVMWAPPTCHPVQ